MANQKMAQEIAMKRRATVQAIAQLAFVMALLLSSGTQALAQETTLQGAEFGEQSDSCHCERP